MSHSRVPLVTIQGTIATHVLGTSSANIGDGDLTLVAATAGDAEPATKKAVLTLTIGNAAFPLYDTTTFGTVAGDERVYVFRPELGEDIKGGVKRLDGGRSGTLRD